MIAVWSALLVAVEGLGPDPLQRMFVLIFGIKKSWAGPCLHFFQKPFQTIQNFPKAKLIFSEPYDMPNKGNFWFEDAKKETLVDRWDKALDEKKLSIHQPEEVIDAQKKAGVFQVRTKVGSGGLISGKAASQQEEGAENLYQAHRIILAIGRRASYRRLKCPGEELEKVAYNLKDAKDYTGQKLLVCGGGDSAVEAAIACVQAGAEVTISYRKHDFSRCKAANKKAIQALIDRGNIRTEFGSTPKEIKEKEVVLQKGEQELSLSNDAVLVFFGTTLPTSFLKRLGLRMSGDMNLLRAAWIIGFALLTYLVYVLKTKKAFFPFGPDHVLGFVPNLLTVQIPGFRTLDPSFWGTCLYAFLVVVFGLRAMRKYPSKVQKKRYLSLMIFQGIFLFGIPELLAPLLIERPWKVYALTVPWPLSIWSLVDAPSWTPGGDTLTAVLWLLAGAFSAFVLIPLYVKKNGERFCSYLCGCGGLAETLGDYWRHLAPRGSTSYKAEWAGRLILLAAAPVTAMILFDAWGMISNGAFLSVKNFAQHWYGLMVDFWLASVVGVALYPYLGNRVWCRFFCPLRAWMEILSRRFSKIAIKADNKCIGCGECTRYCQMGIDVQQFAQKQETFHNGNSACIQCGICIQVCPMDVLSMGERQLKNSPAGIAGPAGY